MPDFAIDIWYDTPPPESKGAIWTEYVTAPDSARATESAMHRFTERHVPGLNVTDVHIKPLEDKG